jgi:phage gpG-like protein
MVEVNVTITPASLAYLKKISDMPKQVPAAIKRGLDSGLEIVKDRLIHRRLSGQGPYPVSQHRLGQVTGLLQATVTTRSVVQGNKVIGYVGSDAPYAGVHEYGAVISAKNAPFLVFKVLGKTIRTKQVTIPARAPFTTEMESAETSELIVDKIMAEVLKLGTEE